MNNTETIVVNISPAGNVVIDAQGFRGKSCENATQHLELALGAGTATRSRKPDYSLPPNNTTQGIQRTF